MNSEPTPMGQGETPQTKVSPTVSVENNGKATSVAIQDVDALFQDIGAYNRRFSTAGSMFSIIKTLMDRADREDEEAAPTNATSEIDEQSQQMTAAGLKVLHKATLRNLGLSLEPVSGKASTIYGPEGAVGTGEMRMNIGDRNQFNAFLSALDSGQVNETPLGQHLSSLSSVLEKQVLDNYDLKQPDDATLSFLGSLDNIVGEYRRLGLAEQAARLQEYLEHARAGNLREFVALRNSGLLQEPGDGFGPADWPMDATPDYLKMKWSEAFALLRALRQNPNSHEMYKQLLEHLNKCIGLSQLRLEGLEYVTPERKGEMMERLKDAEDGLSGFEV